MSLNTNLLNYYKLDGNSNDAVGGNNANDDNITYSAGNGIIVQGAGFSAASTSRIRLTSAIDIYGTTDYTIQCWINTNGGSGYMYTWSDNGGDHQIGLYVAPTTGYLSFVTYEGGYGTIATTVNVANNAWHHIVCTKTGTNGAVYIDNASPVTGTIKEPTTGTLAFTTFGVNRYGTSNYTGYYTGALDEVGVWNRALSSTEVSTLYNSGAGRAYPFPGDTVAASFFALF